MGRALMLSATLALLVPLASPAYAASKETSISGTVVNINMGQKILILRDGKGVEHTVVWNDATELAGGSLAQGSSLTLKASPDEGGKLIASSIRVKTRTSKPSRPALPDQK